MRNREEAMMRLIADINAAEIVSHIEDGTLRQWIESWRETTQIALSALRPVSREQVEKVWKNCEYCTQDSTRREVLGYDAAGDAISIELGCNIAAISSDCTEVLIRFCPMCGTPLTDEAVEMVIRRLEILKDEA